MDSKYILDVGSICLAAGNEGDLVFTEIEKKLEDMIYVKYYQEGPGLEEADIDFRCCHEVIQIENLCHIVRRCK